ncbi:MAG TPA: lipocalin family protein [Chitinophagaceae bacterium]|nr:lipocalin family protein [Chitinophagaceae bacterium]HUM65166.1 lipocalin family protein [Chitinophagaceae bacterium]
MLLRFVLPFISLVLAACDKDNDESKSPTILLTQKNWILKSVGIDDNKNGIIEAEEEMIRECDVDNSYSFFVNGTGLFEEGELDCGTGINELPFTWKFKEGTSQIEFNVNTFKILRLSENELVLNHFLDIGNGNKLSFITSFRH